MSSLVMYRFHNSYLRIRQSRSFSSRISTRIIHARVRKRGLSNQSEASIPKGAEKTSKSWRENPNLKYWVIGVSAITGIIYRYIYKEKDKKKLIVKNFPPLPNHKIQMRNADLDKLYQLHKNLKTSPVTFLSIEGYSGSGKTLLARVFAEKLFNENEKRFCFLPSNLFVGTVNAASLETLLFDMKRFAVAVGCNTKDWMDRVKEGSSFLRLRSDEQLHVILEAVKEKLRANPNWILIIDGLKDEKLLGQLFNDDEDRSSWGKGTVLITGCSKPSLFQVNSYSLDKGMDKEEASELLRDLSGLPEDKLEGTHTTLKKLSYSPLAVACSGNYINSKVNKDSEYSMKQFSDELDFWLLKFVESNQSRNIMEQHKASAYVTASLLVKEYIHQCPHFLHTFDLIGACSLDWPIPVTLVSLHLRSPEFHLTQVPRSKSVLSNLPEDKAVDHLQPKPEEDVQESFLSIKRLASNLESFTRALKANYHAIKEAFYPLPMDTSPPADGVLDLMKFCSLVTVEKVDPGGVETLRVSPVIHEVMSQLFLSRTAPLLERDYLVQAEERHRNSSWFRRLWQFDPQRSLQEFRNSLGENNENKKFSDEKERKAMAMEEGDVDAGTGKPSISIMLKDEENSRNLTSYRFIQPLVATKHYRHHVSLVLNTINDVSSVCSQDVQTRTLAKLLKPHLEHILTTNTSNSLGPKSRAHALSAIASINSALGNLKASLPSLERALEIEEGKFGESSLEVAITLTRLAEVYSSLENPIKARELLERALGIYDLQRKRSGEYKKPLEFARTMEALGAVYGTLGFKQRSKEFIERALSYMQSSGPTSGADEIEGRRFACEVASALTDLGHAYLSAGDAFSGRRMLELAVTGLKNMYGEEHPEVVRALTVLGTAYTMQGNWQEGKKMRREAGKLQAKIDGVLAL